MRTRPSFALEVVGQDIDKDYDDNPALYRALGVEELVLFDPHHTPRSRRRLRWQVFREVRSRGLVRVEVSNGDRVQSRALGCWLREVEHHGRMALRLATGEQGETLVLTDVEQERAAWEQERAAREQAEAEVARLRAELAALKARRPR